MKTRRDNGNQEKTVYTTHEISRLLHVNPRSVINWIDQRLLPSYRTPGGHRRVRREDLLAFLSRHQMPTPASLMNGTFTVLIVDDEEDLVNVIKTYFQRQGSYEVSSACNGIAALIEVGRAKPDLLILDITLPGIDGVEVCRRIKGSSANKTAIIAISGLAEGEKKILEAGADAFMPKPVDLDKLHTEVRRLLRIF